MLGVCLYAIFFRENPGDLLGFTKPAAGLSVRPVRPVRAVSQVTGAGIPSQPATTEITLLAAKVAKQGDFAAVILCVFFLCVVSYFEIGK